MICRGGYSPSIVWRLIGRSKNVGSIETGKYADIIAVSADPLQDALALENVGFVMKGGVVYKNLIGGK